jgi:hypothetical protein
MLMELVFLVGLLGIFSLAAAEIFQWSVALPRRADQTAASLIQFDNAVHRLRQDVWSASAIDLPDAHTAQLRQSDGNIIIWNLGDGHEVSRRISGAQGAPGSPTRDAKRSWQIPGFPMTFVPLPTGLQLEVAIARDAAAHGSASTTSSGTAGMSMLPADTMTSVIPMVSELLILNVEDKP